jgi:hypothetical protein
MNKYFMVQPTAPKLKIAKINMNKVNMAELTTILWLNQLYKN